jgi:hypothetical protein
MDIFDNRLKLLEEKMVSMSIIIKSLEEKNKHLEELSKCSLCKKISELYYCSGCYIKVCGECYNIRERSVYTGDRENIIFCPKCL